MEGETEVHPSAQHSILTVQKAISDFPTSQFAIKLTRAITGTRDPDEQARERGWARVAFTNYVPGTVGKGARVPPSPELWARAKSEFPNLVSELQPRNIIVLGKKMWAMMPETAPDLWLMDDVQGYRTDAGDRVICWAVPHPSRGLAWTMLANLIAFLSE